MIVIYDFNLIENFSNQIECQYKKDVMMKDYTTFRIGGKCKFLFEPRTAAQIQIITKFLNDEKVPFHIIGNGSNLLVSDDGIDGVVVYMGPNFANASMLDTGLLYCRAGTPLSRVVQFAYENSLTGMEFAYGIPGTIGGAVYMNAGAYGGEMKDIILTCDHIDKDGNDGTLTNYQAKFGYRHSEYCDNGFCITGVSLSLKPGKKEKIKAAMDDYINRRKTKQPLEFPSAGSTFKRPEGNYASALVDQCGLKGLTVGGAQVSEKHAGFIINKGGATAKDVLELVDKVQKIVLEQTGYKLECEIKYLS